MAQSVDHSLVFSKSKASEQISMSNQELSSADLAVHKLYIYSEV